MNRTLFLLLLAIPLPYGCAKTPVTIDFNSLPVKK